MRKIKYRAWNKINHVMHAVTNINFSYETGEVSYIYLMDYPYPSPVKYMELLQYTGLKDSKGNEIYEGDIVRYEGSQGVVTWSETAPQFIPLPSVRMLDNHWEVIGNIYEHPHLLEEKHEH